MKKNDVRWWVVLGVVLVVYNVLAFADVYKRQVQDLLRGIDKLLGKGQASQAAPAVQAAPVQVVSAGVPTVDSLLKRGQIFLEDKNWSSADEYFDKVLDMDPECAMAYVGKFCAIMGYAQVDGLAEDTSQLPENAKSLLDKALRFAQPELRERLEQYLAGHEKKKQAEEEKKQAEVERRKKQAEAVRQARLQNVKTVSYTHLLQGGQEGENRQPVLRFWPQRRSDSPASGPGCGQGFRHAFCLWSETGIQGSGHRS